MPTARNVICLGVLWTVGLGAQVQPGTQTPPDPQEIFSQIQLSGPPELPPIPGLSGVRQPGVQAGPVSLDDVLESVNQHFPMIRAALGERLLAEGEYVAAQGNFDLKIKAGFDTTQFGFYRNRAYGVKLEQPVTQWGMTFFGGWRQGSGSFAPYAEKALTLGSGEYSGGFRLPLLRDRAIDRARADLRQADLGRDLADQVVAKMRLLVYKLAAYQYWEWVAAGRMRDVYQERLTLAQRRNSDIAEAVEAGQVPAVDLGDNNRTILERQASLLEATQALQQASVALSLYLRSDEGMPLIPREDQLPAQLPPPMALSDDLVEADLSLALRKRPEVLSLEVKNSQLNVEALLARNQLQPEVNVISQYSRDVGDGTLRRRGNEWEAGLEFELPAQRRKARGKLQVVEAKTTQLLADLQYAIEQVRVEVQAAVTAVGAAAQRLEIVRQEVDLARQLEEAERARFDLGDGTQFLVNLREAATADSLLRLVKAEIDYFKALATYEAAVARPLP